MMISTSNYNFVDFLCNMQKTNDAGIYRVFEFEIPKPADDGVGVINGIEATRAFQELENNYGGMGMRYAQMLGHKPAEIDAFTRSVCDKFASDMKVVPVERYWTATCGTILAGAQLANLIGATFDIPALEKFLKDQFSKNRARRDTEAVQGGTVVHVEEILANFLRDNRDYTIYTDTFPQGKGRPPAISVISSPHLNSGKGVRIQFAIKDKLLRISRSKFREYLAHQKIPPATVMRGLTEHFKMFSGNAMLAANTPWVVLQAHLLCIPVEDGTPLAELMVAQRLTPTGVGEQPAMSPQTPPPPSEQSSTDQPHSSV